MHMLDWNTYRQQLLDGVGGFGKLNPDIIKGYTTLSRAGQKAGHLDEKTRELIALAGRQSPLRCDGLQHGTYRGGTGNGVRPGKRSPKRWVLRSPSMPARPLSIPPHARCIRRRRRNQSQRLRRTHDRLIFVCRFPGSLIPIGSASR